MAHKVAHQLKHPAVQDHIAVAHLNNLDFVQIQETTMEDLYVFFMNYEEIFVIIILLNHL